MDLLALVESPEHVCCRYRIAAFEPYLTYHGVRLTYEAIEASPVARVAQMKRTGRFDGVIIQRKLLDGMSLAALRKSARHLVFDFDDAVLYRDSYAPKGHHCPRRRARFERTVSCADQVLAGNSFLAQLAEEHGAPSTRVRYMPTCVDYEAYESARRAMGQCNTGDRMMMVWIGSSSTLKGLEATASLWNRVGELVPGVALRVVCDRFPRFESLTVEPVEWSESDEIERIVTSDLGVSHVPDDLWSRGKCGLKVLQYMAGGLPVLTNPVGVHVEMVRSGRSGFLVDHPREWLEAVRWLASNRDQAAAMGREAMEHVRRAYDIADWGVFFVDWVMPGSVTPFFKDATSAEPADSQERAWVVNDGETSSRSGIGPHLESKRHSRLGRSL